MVRLPKISIGTKQRKSYFDLSHDVETTSGFGFCQPTVVRHMNANSSSKLTTKIGVRLAPLPCPTFGRIKLRTFNTLVPIQEVFEAYDYMQKKTSVNSALRSYVPMQADTITSSHLFSLLIYQSFKEWKKIFTSAGAITENVDAKPFLNFSFLTPSINKSNYSIKEVDGTKYVIFNDFSQVPIGDVANGDSDYITQGLYYALMDELSIGSKYGYFDFVDNNTSFPSYDVIDDIEVYSAFLTGINDNQFSNQTLKTYLLSRPRGDSYDFLFKCYSFDLTFTVLNPETAQEEEYTVYIPYSIAGNWTFYGQRLFKIMNACGLRGFTYINDVDVNKLFAYYKAWFDNLNPGRSIQWRETNCYKLIHRYYDIAETLDYFFNNVESVYSSDITSTVVLVENFIPFLEDLVQCCFVLPIDNFTASTPEPVMQRPSVEDVSLNITSSDTQAIYHGNEIDGNYPHLGHEETAPLNGLVIDGLMRLYKLANKNSVIGSRIEDYLRTKFGYSIEKSNILSGSEMNIKIDEVFATAGTSDNYLGELAGRGSNQNGNASSIKFECDKPSIFVQFVAIVPYGDYVQGIVKAKIYKNDWYQAPYDSLGKEALGMSEILGRSSDLTPVPTTENSLGFVPMFWRDKVQNSLHNGAFALPSQRALLLPYSLDRLFNERRIVLSKHDNDWHVVPSSVINAGEELRYVERTPDYGNYNRIFVDNTGYFDNFIIHMVQDWDYYAPMKPISQSFETFDDATDDISTSVTAS